VDILHNLPYPDLALFDDGLNTEERCGAIFENPNGELKVIEVPNRHEEPKKHLKIHTNTKYTWLWDPIYECIYEFIHDKNDRENGYGHLLVLTKKG
jgi:hypothetical protein